jgi:hypothetical protein
VSRWPAAAVSSWSRHRGLRRRPTPEWSSMTVWGRRFRSAAAGTRGEPLRRYEHELLGDLSMSTSRTSTRTPTARGPSMRVSEPGGLGHGAFRHARGAITARSTNSTSIGSRSAGLPLGRQHCPPQPGQRPHLSVLVWVWVFWLGVASSSRMRSAASVVPVPSMPAVRWNHSMASSWRPALRSMSA